MRFDWVHNLLASGAIACALGSALIIVWYLMHKPGLTPGTRILLFLGIVALPAGTALMGNIVGFEATKQREFCGSCHVMEPWTQASEGKDDESLAWMHARNEWFGGENCYTCHTDYELFGTVATKLAGLKHLWKYYSHYRDMPVEEAVEKIALYRPYSGRACAHCHSLELPDWQEVEDHAELLPELKAREISCVGKGCHGPAHGLSKKSKLEASATKGAHF